MEIINDVIHRFWIFNLAVLFLGLACGVFVAYSKLGWFSGIVAKKLLHAAVITASLSSVWFLSMQLKAAIAPNTYDRTTYWLGSSLFTQPTDTVYPCFRAVRSESSPRDFDQIVRDNGRYCDWLKKFVTLNMSAPQQHRHIELPRLPKGTATDVGDIARAFPLAITDPVIMDIKNYERDLADYELVQQSANERSSPYLIFFGSLLASFAAGLAFARIAWSSRLSY